MLALTVTSQSYKAQTLVSRLVAPTASPWASLLGVIVLGCPGVLLCCLISLCECVTPITISPTPPTHPNETQQSGSYSSDLRPLSGQFNISVWLVARLFPIMDTSSFETFGNKSKYKSHGTCCTLQSP